MIAGEIRRAITALRLEAVVRRIAEAEAEQVRHAVRDRFVRDRAARWWDALKEPVSTVPLPDGAGFDRLLDLVPDPTAPCWFLVEDGGPALAVYEATPDAVARLVAECYAFEYYLVSGDMAWLLCENHHDCVIGSGQFMVDAIAKLEL